MTAPKQACASKPLLATAPRFVERAEADSLQQAIRDRIAERAYQLYEQSGYQPGDDQRHWFRAEAEVVQRTLAVRESGSWIAVNGELPTVSPDEVQIYVDERRVLVRTQKRDTRTGAESRGDARLDIFLAADLHVDVEPETAAAALKNERLSLTVKKRVPDSMAPIEFARP